MKIKRGGRLLAVLISALIIGGTVGSVLAEEFLPYKAAELRLEQGAQDYDLTEGIEYRSDRYELNIADIGDFDIDVPGKYEVKYSLTPVLSDGESGETVKPEEGEAETVPQVSEPEEQDGNIPSEPETAEVSEPEGNKPSESETAETSEPEGNEPSESETAEEPGTEGNKPSESETAEISEPEGNKPSESETAEVSEPEGDKPSEPETTEESGVEGNKPSEPETEVSSMESNLTGHIPEAVKILSKVTGTVYAEEIPLQEPGTYESGELEAGDGIIYFTRTVRVIRQKASIKYDVNLLLLPWDSDIYQLNAATPSEAERKEATPSETERKEATPSETDKATPGEAEKEPDGEKQPDNRYGLSFKNEALLTEDAYLVDKKGNEIPDTEIHVKDDRELRNAAEVSVNASGETNITVKPGTYRVTLSAVNPLNGFEYTCRREIQVTDGCYIYAPDLVVPANTTNYNPLEGVTVKNSDDRTQNTDVWIKDMTSLYDAGGNQSATPSNAAYLRSANQLEGYPPLRAASFYQILLAAADTDGREITAVRNIRTGTAGHKVFWSDGSVNKTFYGTIGRLEPDGVTAVDEITKNFKKVSSVMIDMSGNDSLTYSGDGSGSLADKIVGKMNGSRLEFMSINLMGHTLTLNGDIAFEDNIFWSLYGNSLIEGTGIRGTLITNGYKLKKKGASAYTVSLNKLNVIMPPDSRAPLEVYGSWQLGDVTFPAHTDLLLRPAVQGETRPSKGSVALSSNVNLGGSLIGDNVSLRVNERGKDNYLGYNRGLGTSSGFEGKKLMLETSAELWLSKLKISEELNFLGSGKLMLVDWQADGASASEVGSITVTKNGSTLYLFSAKPRDGRPMLTVKGSTVFPNTVLTLADLNKSGAAEPSITKFEDLQENKSDAAAPFQAGDIMIHFDDPSQADASHYKCEIDNNISGNGEPFTLKANRSTGDLFLSNEKIFRVTNGGETKEFLTLADAAGYLNTRSGDADITLMTDYTLTAADREEWETKLAGYGGIITVESDKSLDGTNRRLRIPDVGNTLLKLPKGARGIIFKNICFSVDDDKTLYANGVPVTFGTGTEFRRNKTDVNATVKVFGGSGTEPVASTNITVEDGTFGQIYGGGDGQPVTGDTNVTVTGGQVEEVYGLGNGTVSKQGGMANITVSDMALSGIYDFDNLSVSGNVSVAKEINCCRNEADAFRGKVSLSSNSALTLNGTDQAANINKIGSLGTDAGTNKAKLCLKRSGRERTPLIVNDADAPLSIEGEPVTLCYTDDTAPQAEAGDILLQFTNKAVASKAGLKNGTAVSDMSVNLSDGTLRLGQLRLFANLRVEYINGLDTSDEKETGKNLIFTDEAGMETDFKGGYVIGMPYSAAGDPVQSRRYTLPAESWDGISGIPAGGQVMTLTEAGGKKEGRVDNFVHKKDTLYFAHIMDQLGNVYSRMIDTQAPRTVLEPSVIYNEQTQSYHFTVTLQDTVIKDSNLPDDPHSPGVKLHYPAQGVAYAAWSEGPAAGNAAADDAAKAENMVGAGGLLKDIKNLNSPGSQEAVYEFDILESRLKQLMADDKTSVIWIYAKDENNNTVKSAIPIGSNIMDVSVPVKVKLVALAEPGAVNPTPKLLAPVCYIANKGETRVKAEILSFSLLPAAKEARSGSSISLVNKESGFANNELSLKIVPPDHAAGLFAPRNVVNDISPENPLVLGIMEPASGTGSGLDFTFQANFDPINIVLSENWTTGQLAYRFTVVKNTAN